MGKIMNRQRSVEMRRRVVGPWGLNAYALICAQSRSSVLIDPGAEPDALQELLAQSTPAAILITHRHADHIGALGSMRKALRVPVMAHPAGAGHAHRIHPDRYLRHGDRVKVGRIVLRIYHTPGHTEDQICIGAQDDARIIVGDTIFDGGPGKTWSATDFRTTLNSLAKTVLAWSDHTRCYPGHGPDFRLGDKRELIEAFLNKDHGDFYGDATWQM